MPPPNSETGVPFLVISNINKGYISLHNTRFVPLEYYDNLSSTRTPQIGDVLYSIVGSFGIPALVETEDMFCFQRHIALLRPNKTMLDSRCLWYILQTQMIFNKADSIATGTAQRTVPIKGLRQITFKFPSLPEQQEIVRILDSLLKKEQRAREACDIIEKIELMKKAILARAFRGALGTNDPAEESAVELLKERNEIN
jgi:type I restriction enzyme S subunit